MLSRSRQVDRIEGTGIQVIRRRRRISSERRGVFGATGYTGERTARALVARGATPILAARSAERLARLADELGGLETRIADVSIASSMRANFGVSGAAPGYGLGGEIDMIAALRVPARPAREGREAQGRRYVEEWGHLGSPRSKRRLYVRRITLERPGEEDVIRTVRSAGYARDAEGTA